ncbi:MULTISPECIES: hypothetical protein [Fusobacterium]|uniref:hypothetical protein n=1 Tax=Fusobacterium TaxID=848 RepID=UPI0004507733|nr:MULTISPECIES: hypothetical protein [Fusobacterium]EUB35055.1 hypothetical protein HMPREF1498_0349 [Fusobacterium sp. CM1]
MVLVIIAGICLPISIYLFVSIEYELSEKKKRIMLLWATNLLITAVIFLYGAHILK